MEYSFSLSSVPASPLDVSYSWGKYLWQLKFTFSQWPSVIKTPAGTTGKCVMYSVVL